MQELIFFFDVISPYAYLAFEMLPGLLSEFSCTVLYMPVAQAGMQRHHRMPQAGHIPLQLEWTQRQAAWHASNAGVPLQFPTDYPFNSSPYLRQALASQRSAACSREVAEKIFRHIWRGGASTKDDFRQLGLRAEVPLVRAAEGDAVKMQLKNNTKQAIALGLYAVPAFLLDGKLFCGFSGLPMLRAHLQKTK